MKRFRITVTFWSAGDLQTSTFFGNTIAEVTNFLRDCDKGPFVVETAIIVRV